MTFIYGRAPNHRCRIGGRELHCGDCFQIRVDDKWCAVRIEMNGVDGWYLVGMEPAAACEYHLCDARFEGTPDVPFQRERDPRPRYERIHSSAMNYTDASELVILHEVKMFEGRVLVVGNPDWGAYEWVIEQLEKPIKHSNCGYGDSSVALRDGLIVWHGEMETITGGLHVRVERETTATQTKVTIV